MGQLRGLRGAANDCGCDFFQTHTSYVGAFIIDVARVGALVFRFV